MIRCDLCETPIDSPVVVLFEDGLGEEYMCRKCADETPLDMDDIGAVERRYLRCD